MATPGMNNLTTLIKRLEAATSRLEDIASSPAENPQAAAARAAPSSNLAPATVVTAPSGTTTPVAAAPPKAPEEPLPESIEDFDAFIASHVEKWVAISTKIGGNVAKQAEVVLVGFNAERKFLLITTRAKKPDITGKVYQDLLGGINEALMEVTNIKETNRSKGEEYDLLSTVAEGIMVLAWVTVEARPHKHVEECLGSAQFFGNRVLKISKESGKDIYKEWVQSFYALFKELQEYVKRYFSSGIPWNLKGKEAGEVAKEVASGTSIQAVGGAPPPPPPPGGAGGPPPPPPPGPAPVFDVADTPAPAAKSSGSGGFTSVFSELNKGEAVTAGLRKVDKSQMTHKNPSLRASSTVSSATSGANARGKSPAPARKPKPESMRVKKPPKKELSKNMWTVENFDGSAAPIEIEAEQRHSILVSKCNNCTLVVRGKGNSITVENTSRFNLVVDNLISSVDVVKSANFALQVTGMVPTVMMDQVDGAQVYFSREGAGTKVYHSKCAGINLVVLVGGEGDEEDEEESTEVPLPSQICSYFDAEKGQLVNEIVEHSG